VVCKVVSDRKAEKGVQDILELLENRDHLAPLDQSDYLDLQEKKEEMHKNSLVVPDLKDLAVPLAQSDLLVLLVLMLLLENPAQLAHKEDLELQAHKEIKDQQEKKVVKAVPVVMPTIVLAQPAMLMPMVMELVVLETMAHIVVFKTHLP
jgi:hypothetical protein